jgi:hypothetical protein
MLIGIRVGKAASIAILAFHEPAAAIALESSIEGNRRETHSGFGKESVDTTAVDSPTRVIQKVTIDCRNVAGGFVHLAKRKGQTSLACQRSIALNFIALVKKAVVTAQRLALRWRLATFWHDLTMHRRAKNG